MPAFQIFFERLKLIETMNFGPIFLVLMFLLCRISCSKPLHDETFEIFSRKVKMDSTEFKHLILDHRVQDYKIVITELCSILRLWSEFQQKYLQPGIKLHGEISQLVDVYKDACEIPDTTVSDHPQFFGFEEKPHLYSILKEYCDLVRRSYKFVDEFVEPASNLYKNFLERKIKVLC